MNLYGPLWLSAQLAFVTTIILVIVGAPVAWWLARTSSQAKPAVQAVVAMPIVLPPTVLGFYLLILLGPNGAVGSWWVQITGSALTFSFTGLVIASCIYSLPFAVQPMQNAFESLPKSYLERAWTLGASRLDAFFSVAVPLSARGFVSGIVLSFAHTLGEFGVVLMVGGNIPGETRVVSIAIYDHVETLNYAAAHRMSLVLVAFAFIVLATMFVINRRWSER
ncbi:MAG: molybdate ABC transporter permease subunit [Chromatiales bacterium]|nr:MAG: molybdate ABC transporter permease subunit [Chromatiales bacterium]